MINKSNCVKLVDWSLSGCPSCFELFKFVIIQVHCLFQKIPGGSRLFQGCSRDVPGCSRDVPGMCLSLVWTSQPFFTFVYCTVYCCYVFLLSLNLLLLQSDCNECNHLLLHYFKDSNTVSVHFLKQSDSHCSLDTPGLYTHNLRVHM